MRQILHIASVSLRSVPRRLGESTVVTIGIGCVVVVLIMALALATSMTEAISGTGDPSRVLVLRNGAVAESLSSISRDDVSRLRSLPGIARQQGGDVPVSPEVLMNVMLDGVDGLVLVRGLTATGFELRPKLTLAEGRTLTEGKHELIVGRLAQRSEPSLAIGKHLRINAVDWQIVGVFESGGDAHESELLADGPTLMAALARNDFSSATVQLSSAEDFEDFRSAVSAIRGANLKAERESDYYKGQSETMSRLAFIVAYVVSANHGVRGYLWCPEHDLFHGGCTSRRGGDVAGDRVWNGSDHGFRAGRGNVPGHRRRLSGSAARLGSCRRKYVRRHAVPWTWRECQSLDATSGHRWRACSRRSRLGLRDRADRRGFARLSDRPEFNRPWPSGGVINRRLSHPADRMSRFNVCCRIQ